MTRCGYLEKRGKERGTLLNKRIWLFACLLMVFITACRPAVGGVNSPSPETSRQVTSLPASTATFPQGTSQSQIKVPIYTIAFTPRPSISSETYTVTPQPSDTTAKRVTFAAIGDYGSGNQDEGDVARLIDSWQLDFIITLGDNNYPAGAAETMDKAVGQYFHAYLYPYKGSYGEGADKNRFFPTLGNHDLLTEQGQPYFDFFLLPGNERYYDFIWGPVHLFALDNIESEPDGVGVSSIQAQWLKAGLAASTSAWNIVYMHYPPYSSGMHGSTDWARWPYAEWGADAVLAGHDHTYERLEEGGLTYFVNGLGGLGRYEFKDILPGSAVRYNSDYGAMRVEAKTTEIKFEFITRTGDVVDVYTLNK
jgi:tartrate-resistant acid phosphatase type 5